MLPVELGTDGECPACFPAAATALRRDGRRMAVGQLAVGDVVQVCTWSGLTFCPLAVHPDLYVLLLPEEGQVSPLTHKSWHQ